MIDKFVKFFTSVSLTDAASLATIFQTVLTAVGVVIALWAYYSWTKLHLYSLLEDLLKCTLAARNIQGRFIGCDTDDEFDRVIDKFSDIQFDMAVTIDHIGLFISKTSNDAVKPVTKKKYIELGKKIDELCDANLNFYAAVKEKTKQGEFGLPALIEMLDSYVEVNRGVHDYLYGYVATKTLVSKLRRR